MLDNKNIKDIYRASPMQEGMYFHFLSDPYSSAYLEQFSYRLQGPLNIAGVESSLNILFERHDILRTIFNHEKVGQVLQVVLKRMKVKFSFHDVRTLRKEQRTAFTSELKSTDRSTPFDLNKDVLMRVQIVQEADEEFEIVWSHHHILLDGWSVGLLLAEYNAVYSGIVSGKMPVLSPVRQYRTYIDWLQGTDNGAGKEFWRGYLQGYEQFAAIPGAGHPRTGENTYSAGRYVFGLGKETTEKVKALSGRHKVTLNCFLQNVWGVLIAKYNNCRDVVFGTVVSGRPAGLPDSTGMIGLFINTIPCRIHFSAGQTFAELIIAGQRTAGEMEPFHYYHLARIQSETQLRNKLFDHLVVFENYPIAEQLQQGTDSSAGGWNGEKGYVLSNVEVVEQTNYDLTLLLDVEQEIRFQFNFNRKILATEVILAMEEHLRFLIDQLIADPSIPIDELEIITSAERNLIQTQFNNTRIPFSANASLHGLFERQVILHPAAIALRGDGIEVSYEELNAMANRIARLLTGLCSVERGDIVALKIDRSVEMIASILGIVKAGAAYLPLDPGYPAERTVFILSNAGARLLLTADKLGELDQYATENLRLPYNSTDLAYVIYTSGSTGQPKGVMIEHRSVVNRIEWMWRQYGFDATDRIFQKTPFVFDVSVWEIFMPLCFGASMVICPADLIFDPQRIAGHIGRHGVTTVHFVPGMFNFFLDAIAGNSKEVTSLRRIFTSGEALLPETVKRHYNLFDIPLFNLYGPTEAAVDVTYYTTKPGDTVIPIGKPIDNIQMYILDQNGKMMPIGIWGEICIGGVGVARGYLNQPELTAGRFVAYPAEPGTVVYHTGDIGRWLLSGNIEFLGRKDSQVKINGNRIELGEVENNLLRIKGIEDAAVLVVRQAGFSTLHAYLRSADVVDETTIRKELAERLPKYMIPASFFTLREFPLTASGKIDRGALAGMKRKATRLEVPVGPVERKLLKFWQDVFEDPAIGIEDEFFEAGGHSLVAIKLVSLINREFRVRVNIKDIFSSDIAGIAAMISKAKQDSEEETGIIEEQEYYDATHGQSGLYFKQKYKKETASFNMFKVIEVADLDGIALACAFHLLLDRHESLRTSFIEVHGQPKQKIRAVTEFPLPLEHVPLPGADEMEIRRQIGDHISRPFDQQSAPLIGIKVFESDFNRSVVLIVLDHILSDAWSMQLIQRELLQMYNAVSAGIGGSGPMPARLVIQFRDYSAAQQRWLRSADAARAVAFWKRTLSAPRPVMHLLEDHPVLPAASYREGLQMEMAEHFIPLSSKQQENLYGLIFSAKPLEGASYRLVIGETTLKGLQQLAGSTKTSLFSVLAASVNLFIYNKTGVSDIVLGTPVSLREQESTYALVGWFLDTLILRNSFYEEETVTDVITRVATNMADALVYRYFPFERILDELALPFDVVGKLFIHLLNFDTLDQRIRNFERVHRRTGTPTFDLNLTWTQYANGLELVCDYRKERYKPSTIASLLGEYVLFLDWMIASADKPVRDSVRLAATL
jgi:amino acid adenylation domain-containing protein